MSTAALAADSKRFSYRRTAIVGFGLFGINVIWPILNQFVPIFLQAGNPAFEQQLLEVGRELPQVVGFGLTPAVALFIMTWDNLINVFFQPWVGARSDRTWNRFGRRKPWILAGMPIAVVGFVLLPFAQVAVALFVFIFITKFGMALFRSPTVAWLGDLFLPEDRSKANGVINLMGGIGGLLAFFGGGYLFNNYGRAAPFIGGALLMVAAISVALVGVKEPEPENQEAQTQTEGLMASLRTLWKQPHKSELYLLSAVLFWFMAFNALQTGLSSFAVFTLGIAPGTASIYAGFIMVTFILTAVPAGLLGTRYGRRPVIQVGLAILIIIYLAGYFFIQGPASFIGAQVLTGTCMALVTVNSLPLVYDYGDEQRIGAFTGLYYFASYLAAVLGPTLGGIMVDSLNDQYRWLFIFSAVFMALAFVAISRVR